MKSIRFKYNRTQVVMSGIKCLYKQIEKKRKTIE